MDYMSQISFSVFNSPIHGVFSLSIYLSEYFMNLVRFLVSLLIASSSTAKLCIA